MLKINITNLVVLIVTMVKFIMANQQWHNSGNG